MNQAAPVSLGQYILESQRRLRPDATGDFSWLLSGITLAAKVIDLTGSPSKIVARPLPQDDPMQRCPDIRLAQERLQWEPRVGLDEGLRRTIAYFEGLLRDG